MKKLVVFDFDGTIVDSLEESYRITEKLFNIFNINIEWKNIREYKRVKDKQLVHIVKKHNIKRLKLLLFLTIAYNFFMKEYEPKIIKGIDRIIKKLKKKNVYVAINSSNFKRVIKKVLKKYNLLQYFDAIESFQLESKIDKMKKLIKKFKVKEEDVIFITDTINDIKEMENTNIITIGVTWGFDYLKELKKARPNYICKTVKELDKVLTNILRINK